MISHNQNIIGDSFADLAFIQDQDHTVWPTVDGTASTHRPFRGMVTAQGLDMLLGKIRCRQSLNLNEYC